MTVFDIVCRNKGLVNPLNLFSLFVRPPDLEGIHIVNNEIPRWTVKYLAAYP
jgi:hypothetical protein